MEHTFTAATLFWLFVPMPLLIVFSLISLFAQYNREKKQNSVDNAQYEGKLTSERGGS